MAKPTEYLNWSVNLTNETKTIKNKLITFPQRESIPTDYANVGILYGTTVGQQYLNQALWLAGEWTTHLDQRIAVGHLHYTTINESVGTIGTRLGGTWVARGSQVQGTTTAFIYEKTV